MGSGRTYAEDKLQSAAVAFCRAVAPQAIIFAVPNGGLRSKREAARLKWTGVLAGVPDLCIVAPGGIIGFVEVKTQAGSLSSEQREMRDKMAACLARWATIRSVDDMREVLRAWGIETREAAQIGAAA